MKGGHMRSSQTELKPDETFQVTSLRLPEVTLVDKHVLDIQLSHIPILPSGDPKRGVHYILGGSENTR